jgi:lipopolysaccharide/colanic/teichoic acid biosynthesis glycosyltransferase
VKRLFDFVAASLALLLLALPLLALVWLIRSKLGSPVLFRQVNAENGH